jgi:predicted phage-related endonuclease
MKVHDLLQGTPEWSAYRAQHFNASDAPAMLGCSPYKTRAELLREMHTGLAPEIDPGTQKRFDNGHRLEALARPLAEEFIGAELYPVTGSEGRLSASFDGLTMDETAGMEHKALNADLRTIFAGSTDDIDGSLLPLMHRVQMEQQLLVSGAERILFMTSEWDANDNLIEEHHCWYYPDLALRDQIVAGWAQFESDLAAYVMPESAEPAPVGKAPDTLPALRIEVTGQVTASNLAEFKATALAAIRSVNRELATDQDFADAEKAVKWCVDVEDRLKAAKEHALSQTTTIDALFKAIDDISAEARRVRLDLDKLVTRRKTEVKEDAIVRARKALDTHIAVIHAEIAPMRMLPVAADFAGAIKGKKSLASMQDALDGVLAAAKIDADAAARAIRANVAAFQAKAAGLEFLFADLGQIVHKAADDFATLVQARIDAHKAAEAERERRRAADEAQRLADEARAAAEKRMGLAYDETSRFAGQDSTYEVYLRFAGGHGCKVPMEKVDDYIVALGVLRAESTAQNTPQQGANRDASTGQSHGAEGSVSPTGRGTSGAPALSAAPVLSAAYEPATLRLGMICDRLGFTLPAVFIADKLGIHPVRTEGAAKMYRPSDFGRICAALQDHIARVSAPQLTQGVPA